MSLKSSLDRASHLHLAGWAWDPDFPESAVSLVVTVNDRPRARLRADRLRQDLAEAAIGNGHHSFELQFDPPLSPLGRQVIGVYREGDGRHLFGSPKILEPSVVFDGPTREAVAHLLVTADGEATFAERLAFLTDLTDRLRQRQADRGSASGNRRQQHAAGAGRDAESPRPRALVIGERMPVAGHDAGSNALLSHMRALQRLGYDVTFAPANLRGDGSALEAEGIACCLHPWSISVEEVLMRRRGTFALVYLHRASTAARYAALARDNQPEARLVYSVAELSGPEGEMERGPQDPGEEIAVTERSAAWQADAVIVHSSAEAERLRRHFGAEKIHCVAWSPGERPTAVPFIERRGLAFIGSYGRRANVEAALRLADVIVPELDAQGASLPCHLVGSDMPDSLRGLRRHDVDPVGHVPDLATIFDRVRLTVAPLAGGAGISGKVLDSLAAGVPCVCSPAAAEGMDLPEPLLRLVAATPAEFARSIRALHDDEALNRECREAGLAYVAREASETAIDDRLRAAFARTNRGDTRTRAHAGGETADPEGSSPALP